MVPDHTLGSPEWLSEQQEARLSPPWVWVGQGSCSPGGLCPIPMSEAALPHPADPSCPPKGPTSFSSSQFSSTDKKGSQKAVSPGRYPSTPLPNSRLQPRLSLLTLGPGQQPV